MVTVLLSMGMSAVVSDKDAKKVNRFKWCARKDGRNFYAQTVIPNKDNPCGFSSIRMHRFILDNPKKSIDHIDRNGLNNSRSNLRLTDGSGNQWNRRINATNKSGFRGVYWDKDAEKWVAYTFHNKKEVRLGHSDDRITAAKIYDKKIRQIRGNIAELNFK